MFQFIPASATSICTLSLVRSALLCVVCVFLSSLSHALERSDILKHIVQQCIKPATTGYCEQCRTPVLQAGCAGKSTCQATTEVWAETSEFVAIRDIKMCGCPAEFVHGLVMPKAIITGVEDPLRPDGIWQFAWDVAIQRIPVGELALAVNSKNKRTQNQLHVHLVRLKPGPLPALEASVVGVVPQLSEVWSFASLAATRLNMPEHGVLVTAAEGGGYRVAITALSPEGQFTQAVCQP
jgi:CDP-diacylglycerol pyrophosphatase